MADADGAPVLALLSPASTAPAVVGVITDCRFAGIAHGSENQGKGDRCGGPSRGRHLRALGAHVWRRLRPGRRGRRARVCSGASTSLPVSKLCHEEDRAVLFSGEARSGGVGREVLNALVSGGT